MLKTIGILLLLLCLYILYIYITQIVIPHRSNVKSQKHTDKLSSLIKNSKDSDYGSYFKTYVNSKKKKFALDCKIYTIDKVEFEICSNDTNNYSQKIPEPLEDRQSKVNITFGDDKKSLELNIYNTSNYEFEKSITHSKKYFFIGWVKKTQLADTTQYSIKIEIIEKSTGKLISQRTVLSKGFGINNLSIAYHFKTDSIVLAWNDWHFNSSEDLFLADISMSDLMKTKKSVDFKQILTSDKWDKTQPYFLNDKEELYLVHSTSSHYGIASYSGMGGSGISLIDNKLNPTKYKILNTKTSQCKILKVQDGLIYFTRSSVANSNHMDEILTIPFTKAYEF